MRSIGNTLETIEVCDSLGQGEMVGINSSDQEEKHLSPDHIREDSLTGSPSEDAEEIQLTYGLQRQPLASESVGLSSGESEVSRTTLPPAVDVLVAVEKDAVAVAESVSRLMESLREALAEATQNTVQHMRVHTDAAGLLQDATLEAASKGNRFVNACLRLNEEMRGVTEVAAQIKALRRRLDHFELQANRYLPRA